MATAQMQGRGQVTIPARIREALGLRPGDLLVLRVTGAGRIEAEVLHYRSLSSFLEETVESAVALGRLREEMGDALAREYLGKTGDATASDDVVAP